MSLLDTASLIITPNGTKASKLYSVVPSSGAGDMTVTRATTATRVNSAGLIESVASNVPRLDYSNGTCPSILVEPQRTNVVLNSETLATQSISVTAQSYTLSFYGSGTVTLSGTHSATVVGLGTARKTYTFTPTAGTLFLTISGTCTKGQLESGSYATSYIPTTSASVTRNADVISKTGISSLIGQTEGTLFVDFYHDGSQNYNLSSISNGLYDDAVFFEMYLGNIYGVIYDSGLQQFLFEAGPLSIGRHKMAIGYKTNDTVFYIDGVLKTTDNNVTIPTTSRVDIGFIGGGSINKTQTNLTALWKTRLTNTQLAQLTTI